MKPVYIDIHIHTSEDPNRINTDYNCDVLMEQVRKISGEAEVLLSLTDHNNSLQFSFQFPLLTAWTVCPVRIPYQSTL